MEGLKFKKNKKRYFTVVLLISIIIFFSLKQIVFFVYSNTYFTEGRSYKIDDDYLNTVPKLRVPLDTPFSDFKDLNIRDLYFKIPKKNLKDSIKVVSTDNLNSLFINYFALGKLNKSLILTLDKIDVSKSILADLSDLGINETSVYKNYEIILNQKPVVDISSQSIGDIRKSLKLSSIKQVIYTRGSENGMYKFNDGKFGFIQFCSPKLCNYTTTKIFINKIEATLLTKGFTQLELDFILRSIRVMPVI